MSSGTARATSQKRGMCWVHEILSYFRSTLRKGTKHGQMEEGVCGPPGEILKTEFMGLPAQFWLNLQNNYDLRIAEGSGVGKGIKPREIAHDAELSGTASYER